MSFLFYMHTIDEYLINMYNFNMFLVQEGFSIFGLHVSFYGLIIALGMMLSIFVVCKIAKYRNLSADDIYLVALYVLPFSIIGARLYFVIFSDQAYTFWEVFKIWEGGMAIYGGVIGGAIGVILYCLIHKKNFFDVADVAVVGLILGQAIGRIGCYFAGCCYGIAVTNEALMWFPFSTQINGVWHLSTFFYESFCNFIIFIVFVNIIKKVKTKGVMMSLYLMLYGSVRCIIETFRGDSLYIGTIKVSQLLSAILILSGIILLICIYTINKKNKVNKNENNNISKNI